MILRRVFGFILLLTFIFQMFSKVFIIADYYINKDFIAKVLCINKDKPKMHCEGKCHLKKQLEKEAEKEQSPVNPVKDKNEIQLFSEKRNDLSFLNVVVSGGTSPSYQFSISNPHLVSVFHPPKV